MNKKYIIPKVFEKPMSLIYYVDEYMSYVGGDHKIIKTIISVLTVKQKALLAKQLGLVEVE